MTWLRTDGGSASLVIVAALPLLMLVVAGVLEIGSLRLLAGRARAAADLATLVAVDDQDDRELARSGRLVLAPDAAEVARAYFALNVETIGPALASDAATVAAGADVAVFADAPAVDPRTGERYDQPTVRLAASVPLRTPILGSLLGRAVTPVAVRSASAAR